MKVIIIKNDTFIDYNSNSSTDKQQHVWYKSKLGPAIVIAKRGQ